MLSDNASLRLTIVDKRKLLSLAFGNTLPVEKLFGIFFGIGIQKGLIEDRNTSVKTS